LLKLATISSNLGIKSRA